MAGGPLLNAGRYAYFSIFGELYRVGAVIDQYLADAQRIANQAVRHIGCNVKDQFKPFAACLFIQQCRNGVKYLFKVEFVLFNRQLAGLYFGKVKNVIDDAQKMLGRSLDFSEIVPLARGGIRFQRQVGHADNGVHGGADFMAHIGQEIGLDFSGQFGSFFGGHQLVFSQFPLGYINKGNNHPHNFSILMLRVGPVFDWK